MYRFVALAGRKRRPPRKGAREILAEGVARKETGGDIAPSGTAAAYAAVGDIGEAPDWLERCFDEEMGIYMLRSPGWRPLWGYPRFQALRDRVELLRDPPEAPPSGGALAVIVLLHPGSERPALDKLGQEAAISSNAPTK